MDQPDSAAAALGRPLPVVTRATTLREAVAILSDARVRWLIVAEPDGVPRAAVGGNDVLRALMPPYLLEDTALARVYNQDGAREVVVAALGKTIGDLLDTLDPHHWRLPTVSAEPTPLELAATFLESGSTVAYIDGTAPDNPRFATLPGLFQHLIEVID